MYLDKTTGQSTTANAPEDRRVKTAMFMAAQGYTHAEIAAMLDQPAAHIEARLRDASEQRRVACNDLTPRRLLVKSEAKYAMIEEMLFQELVQARLSGNYKAIAALTRE